MISRDDLYRIIKGSCISYDDFDNPIVKKAGHVYCDRYGRDSWERLDKLSDQELNELYLICTKKTKPINKELKIEVGKFYRTKGGKKARIYSTDRNYSDMIHGAFLSKEGWRACLWANNGKAVFDDNNSIISEWQEPLNFNPFDLPSWANWIAMEPNKDWYFFMNKPELHDEEWYSDETFAFIPPQVAPKDYQGNWEESLHNVAELKKKYRDE